MGGREEAAGAAGAGGQELREAKSCKSPGAGLTASSWGPQASGAWGWIKSPELGMPGLWSVRSLAVAAEEATASGLSKGRREQ